MKWGDFIARTAVRRVVYIIIGAIIAAGMTWLSPAHAQANPYPSGSRAAALWSCRQFEGGRWPCQHAARPDYPQSYSPMVNGSPWTFYQYQFDHCPAGQPWDDAGQQCGNECATKPPMTGVASRGDNGAFCSGGCSYSVDMDSPMRTLGSGAERTTFGTFRASGATCTVDTPIDSYDPNRAICNTVASNNDGTVSQCVRPDGMTCVAMGGARLCYAQGETGDRMTSDGKLATNRVNEGQTPRPPANQQNPQLVTTTTTTINNTTTVTSIFGGSGASPGQSNVGSGGKDSDGAGGGSGEGGGDGEGDGEGDGPGGVGADVGTLYEGSGKTLGGVYEEFKAQAMQAPILAAATGFFSAPSGGGACPVWTIPASDWIQAPLVFDFFCASELDLLLVMAGWVLMTLAAYKAWTIFAGH